MFLVIMCINISSGSNLKLCCPPNPKVDIFGFILMAQRRFLQCSTVRLLWLRETFSRHFATLCKSCGDMFDKFMYDKFIDFKDCEYGIILRIIVRSFLSIELNLKLIVFSLRMLRIKRQRPTCDRFAVSIDSSFTCSLEQQYLNMFRLMFCF